ncbi:MAG: RNA polymerase sigma factor [Bacteroidota bacterium]
MHPPNDILHWLAACAQGNRKAQLAVFEHCYGYGLTVARYYASNAADAKDILQDSYVKFFRQLNEGQLVQAWKPWFRKVIIRTAIDYYRRKKKQGKIIDLARQRRTTVDNLATESLNQADLYRLLQQLPPSYRLVFNLHVIEGFSHPEIARQLGISVGTSKSNLAKARRKLKIIAPPFFSLENKLSHG